MNDEKFMLVSSVIEGKLDMDYVSLEEVQEYMELIFNVVANRNQNTWAPNTLQ